MYATFGWFQNRLQFVVNECYSFFVFADDWVIGILMKQFTARHVIRVFVDAHVVTVRKRVGKTLVASDPSRRFYIDVVHSRDPVLVDERVE
ncbi:MAG: hypothetical protein KDA87_23740 [Planctomycetales bacterium]|nr:hypothetical protein [Planctomycetales bacterium]